MKPLPVPLERACQPWLFATALAATLPHAEHLPLWLLLAAAGGFAAAVALWRRGAPPPARWALVLAVAAGCTSSAVASALGHGSFAVTAKHYVHPDTLRNSTVRRVADALATSSHPDDEVAQLLDRLRTLSPEARSTLLLALAAQTAN